MKKRDIVRSNILFNDIIEKGKRVSNKYFVICMQKKDYPKNNYGIAVGKKIGNAVVRNKIKRQIRNIITKNAQIFPNFHNYIIICKKDILNITYKDMEDAIINLIKKGETHEK